MLFKNILIISPNPRDSGARVNVLFKHDHL
jgi:hypothetical protein